MASSKLMSRNSDLKRKLSSRASISSSSSSAAAAAADFMRIDGGTAGDSFVSDSPVADAFFKNAYVERSSSSPDHSCSGTLLNAEMTVMDAVAPISDGDRQAPRKTVDDVWREILAGKKKELQQKQQPKEEMMTLEDFLVKAGAVEKEETAIVEVKNEMLSGGMYSYENSRNYSGGMIGLGSVDVGGLGRGTGKRSMSLLEPLDKAAQQRQRRMIKNRESAARSRERKQAYQEELESMAVRLEEENERLLKEQAEQTKQRLKQLMENVIPITEKRRPPRVLRKVRSMQW